MIIWIAIFGALGVVSRYLMSKWANGLFVIGQQTVVFPVGTLIVNVLGSFIMGFLFSFFLYKWDIGEPFKTAILVGFLGGFTTFSSFSIELVRMIDSQQWLMALSYVLLSVLLCVIFCFFGFWLARVLA